MLQVKIYPKKWAHDFTYLKSPHSKVVHFCFPTADKKAYPLCGIRCWKNVIPVLVEDIESDPSLRICKNCARFLGDDFWLSKLAKRIDYIDLEHCNLRSESHERAI